MPAEAVMQAIHAGYGAYFEAMRAERPDPAAVFAAYARFRILCAVREGPRGVLALNQMVSSHFRQLLNHPLDTGERCYPGRAVMVLRNDPVLKLYNGDIGIVLPDAGNVLMVYFPDSEAGFRSVAPIRLPEHETAFAMTIHKSQGSEFDAVLVMLPAQPSRVLTRELIYTAITRARSRMILVGSETVLGRAIQTVTL